MMLAAAISVGEQELICDFAETYHIFNYRELPVKTLAALCFGLRDDSRVKLKIVGTKVDIKTMLLAGIYDSLAFIAWSKTKDGQKNVNKPKSVLKSLTEDDAPESDVEAFATGDDFDAAFKRLTGGA